jgi:hypothetical protein
VFTLADNQRSDSLQDRVWCSLIRYKKRPALWFSAYNVSKVSCGRRKEPEHCEQAVCRVGSDLLNARNDGADRLLQRTVMTRYCHCTGLAATVPLELTVSVRSAVQSTPESIAAIHGPMR